MIDRQFLADCTKQLASGLMVYVYKKEHIDLILERFEKKYGGTKIIVKERKDYFELKAEKKVKNKLDY